MLLEAVRLTAIAFVALAGRTWFGGVHDERILLSIGIFACFRWAGCG